MSPDNSFHSTENPGLQVGLEAGAKPIRYMTGRGAAVVGIGGYARPRAASR